MIAEYQIRKLPKNREYAAYQFYAKLTYKGEQAQACFAFAVLTALDWLRERMRDTDAIPDEISALPDRHAFRGISPDDLKSFHISPSFTADCTSLPQYGLWTLRLKEPDSDTAQRKAVPGRFFTTNVGIHIMSADSVELGIRIDVTDPEGADEIDHAFRPKFVRYLFSEEDLTVEHSIPLSYEKAYVINDDKQFKLLRDYLDNSQSQMPVVIFVESFKLPQAALNPKVASNPLDSKGNMAQFLSPSPFSAQMLFQPKKMSAPKIEHFYPFDTDEFASHAFGYGLTFALPETYYLSVKKRLRKEFDLGDILFVEPKRYGGTVRVYNPGASKVCDQIQAKVHLYSKHKSYSFGHVQFEYDARSIAQHERIAEIQQSTQLAADEKLLQLNKIIEDLQSEKEAQIQKIDELKQQNTIEFEKGVDSAHKDMESLLGEYDDLQKKLQQLQANNDRLQSEVDDARNYKKAAETFRSLSEMPQSADQVLDYFLAVFADRLAFTERGMKTTRKCDIRPDALWFYFYRMATTLLDLFRNDVPDIESAFMEQTGIEIAFGEGAQSRKDNSIMRIREDTYNGKAIFVEPHVKLNDQKAGAASRRIYFCYDHEIDRIIIGSVGEHLRTYGTQFIK